MNTKEQWEEELKNIFYREFEEVGIVAIDSTYSSILDFIRETREQAWKDGYSAGLQNSVLQSGGAKPQPLTGKI